MSGGAWVGVLRRTGDLSPVSAQDKDGHYLNRPMLSWAGWMGLGSHIKFCGLACDGVCNICDCLS